MFKRNECRNKPHVKVFEVGLLDVLRKGQERIGDIDNKEEADS